MNSQKQRQPSLLTFASVHSVAAVFTASVTAAVLLARDQLSWSGATVAPVNCFLAAFPFFLAFGAAYRRSVFRDIAAFSRSFFVVVILALYSITAGLAIWLTILTAKHNGSFIWNWMGLVELLRHPGRDPLRLALAALLALVIHGIWMRTLVIPGRLRPGSLVRRVLAYSTPFLLLVLLVCISGYLRFSSTPATDANRIREGLAVIVLALCWVFMCFSLELLLLNVCYRLFRTLRLVGKMGPSLALRTYRLRRRIHPEESLRSNLLFAMTVVAVNVVVFKTTQMSVFLYLLGFQLVTTLHIVGSKMIPPAVLFLSSSRADTLGVQAEIEKAVCPLVVTSLIDPSSSTGKSVGHLDFQSCRTSPYVDWLHAVRSLAEIAPIVVLDIRDPTRNIEAELSLVLSQGLAYKTIFLVRDGVDRGSAGASFMKAGLPTPRMECKEELLRSLRSMTTSSSELPGPPPV